MAWDLGTAMRKKEEFESARLMDFAFRQRARATRMLAQAFGLEESALIAQTALRDEAGVIALVAERTGAAEAEVTRVYHGCLVEARAKLIAERGDPAPYRLG